MMTILFIVIAPEKKLTSSSPGGGLRTALFPVGD